VTDVEGVVELNAKELTITGVEVDGIPVPFRHEKDIVSISNIPMAKEHSIVLQYEKKIRDDVTTGVFKSRYGNRYFIATDFEPDRARTFFPCKDDPSWKAVFNLSVVTDADLKVISNSPLSRIEDTNVPGKKRHVFEPTPKMSTYLFFVGVGRFTEVSRRKGSGPTVTVAGRPEGSQRADFVLETACNAIAESGDYFGVPYPLKKLHLIALPEFGGAMENWGAITSYEAALLVAKGASTLDRKATALTTIHEIQHQWFGDLVTMKWWDDIWLNESFATFMSYKMTARLHPEWDSWSDFLTSLCFDSMAVDELRASHPIQAKIGNPAEINEVFDRISYGKGASILRMVESFLGEDTFRRGVSEYIRRFSYLNARGEDLWKSLENASDQPVSKIMGAWITRPGFPLVTIERKGTKLIFKQKRFMLTGGDSGEDSPWPIPMNLRINEAPSKFLFDTQSKEIEISGGDLHWAKANLGQTGYYCVKYDDAMYDALAASFTSLDPQDRAGIMNDLFELLKAEEIDPTVYFRFVRLCRNLDDYPTCLLVSTQLQLLWSIANTSKDVEDVNRSFLTAQLGRLTTSPIQGERENDGYLRGRFASMLARSDVDFAKKLAEEFDQFQTLDSNMKSAVAVAYARTVGRGAFDYFEETLVRTEDEQERSKMYAGLVSFDDPGLIKSALDFVASGKVSRSDSYWPLFFGTLNPRARQAEWDWIKGNFNRLGELLGSKLFVIMALERFVPVVAVGSETDARDFFSGDRLSKGELGRGQILELLSVYAKLGRRLA
jgi:tricorn protease interacting factor F2/3